VFLTNFEYLKRSNPTAPTKHAFSNAMDVQEFCFDPSVGSIKWGYQNDVDAYVILAFDKLKAGTQFPLRETEVLPVNSGQIRIFHLPFLSYLLG